MFHAVHIMCALLYCLQSFLILKDENARFRSYITNTFKLAGGCTYAHQQRGAARFSTSLCTYAVNTYALLYVGTE